MPVLHCPLPYTCHIHTSLIHPTSLSGSSSNQVNALLLHAVAAGNIMLTTSVISAASMGTHPALSANGISKTFIEYLPVPEPGKMAKIELFDG